MSMKKLSNFFSINIKSLTFTALWFNPKLIGQTSKLLVFYVLAVNTFCVGMPQICHVIYMYKARNNVKAFADEFYVSLTSLMVVFKDVSMMKNFGKIQKMLEDVDSETFKPRTPHQKSMIFEVN